jgi:hypothetical protein
LGDWTDLRQGRRPMGRRRTFAGAALCSAMTDDVGFWDVSLLTKEVDACP